MTMNSDMSAKVMLLTNQLHKSPSGGRELLCKLNHDALEEIYGDRLVVFELPRVRLQGVRHLLNAFRGYIDGLDEEAMARALMTIQSENVGKVFVDGSNLGGLVKVAKRRFPQVQISSFFHNVEARFFLGSLKESRTPRALAVLLVNYLAERKAVRYSDKIICLSERDSRMLQRLYGRAATHKAPMALQDKLPVGLGLSRNTSRGKFALFVGGVFYANRAGITWFVEQVVPRINVKICIVGRGFEDFKQELERDGKVEVVGAVDSLAQWYLDSHFVIAPIFDGSGMKTKVAEALMFGKKVIGTPEAFSGYEKIADRVGCVCASADEFVAAIEVADTMVNDPFDSDLRAIFESTFSFPAARARLESILNS